MNNQAKQTNLIRRIRRKVKRRETYVASFEELRGAGADWGYETDLVRDLAEKAQCDWLYSEKDLEARFFEGN